MSQDRKADYIGAPYNFVSLPANIYHAYQSIKDLPGHDELTPTRENDDKKTEEALSGEIHYRVSALSQLHVGSLKEKFYENLKGNHAIPATTMRGLIRSNVQILGFSSIGNDVEDQRFMYRDPAYSKPAKREEFNNTLGAYLKDIKVECIPERGAEYQAIIGERAENVKAGYIRKSGDGYEILPIKGDRSNDFKGYYRVYNDMDTNKKVKRWGKYLSLTRNVSKELEQQFGKQPNKFEITFKINNERVEIRQGHQTDEAGFQKGYLLISGKMDGKKVTYIIPEIGEKPSEFRIPDEVLDRYRQDLKDREKQLKNENGYYSLPEQGITKPVFYIKEGEYVKHFGFTPYLRVAYKHSVFQGLGVHNTKGKVVLDYSSSIFGFATQEASYKSRVQFFDAEKEKGELANESRLLLLGPKPANYLDYLKPEKGTYNSDDVQIRGIKQYWLHKVEHQGKEEKKSESVPSTFTALQAGAFFSGKIKFNNLYPDELGLLLWSIQLNKGSLQNLGHGKPYGYGKVKIDITDVSIYDFKKLYSNHFIPQDYLQLLEKEEIQNYIDRYKKRIQRFVKEELKKDSIDSVPSIAEFFFMKSAEGTLEEEEIGYMDIEFGVSKINQFAKRKKGIKTPLEYRKNGG